MKKLFWKTYKATFKNKDNTLVQTVFFRGTTWDVVEMATKHADKKTKDDGIAFACTDLERVY